MFDTTAPVGTINHPTPAGYDRFISLLYTDVLVGLMPTLAVIALTHPKYAQASFEESGNSVLADVCAAVMKHGSPAAYACFMDETPEGLKKYIEQSGKFPLVAIADLVAGLVEAVSIEACPA